MKNKRELDVQSNIVKSAKLQGGYGKKISHKFSVGVPDLLIAIPPFAPCVVEVKDLGAVTLGFNRMLDVTPKQSLEMARISEPYEEFQVPYTPSRRTACVMVALKHRDKHRLVVLPRIAERLSSEYEADPGCWVEREVGGTYNIKRLLEHVGICRVKLL